MISLLFMIANLVGWAQTPPTTGQVSSTFADYDGNMLTLKGKVQLEHPIGTIRSEEAFLEKEEENKEFPFSVIHLHRSILVSLKNNAQLKGDNADLDFHDLSGMISAEEGKQVSYTDPEFELKSQSIEFDIVKKENTFTVKKLRAYPQEGKKCVVTKEKDLVKADLITADTSSSKLFLQNPEGIVNQVAFSADRMIWDNNANTLTLEEKIDLSESGMGALQADFAFIQCTDHKPILFSFKGNIRLFSHKEKNRFAVGDTLTYFPTEKNFHIKAAPGKKVLFFDEAQSLYISANEIRITNMDSVKGVGNVQLRFSPEEEALFKSYFPNFAKEPTDE